jgi:hypothetical protein
MTLTVVEDSLARHLIASKTLSLSIYDGQAALFVVVYQMFHHL